MVAVVAVAEAGGFSFSLNTLDMLTSLLSVRFFVAPMLPARWGSCASETDKDRDRERLNEVLVLRSVAVDFFFWWVEVVDKVGETYRLELEAPEEDRRRF